MEQRSLRLGDIVDDYCPRERRLTNHAIVAIVEDAIRQTRCTTCDYEHVYKQGREPRRRKPSTGSLFDRVLADVAGPPRAAARIVASDVDEMPEAEAADSSPPEAIDVVSDGADRHPTEEAWPAHRTLIRASLPKLTGEPAPPRPIPEFTMHQKPQSSRGRQARLLYGPQGDPFGRPIRGGQAVGRVPGPEYGNGNGHGNGAGHGHQGGPAGAVPAKRRGRRRRGGKRSH